MKTLIIGLVCLNLCVQAKSASLTTIDGVTYDHISKQRVEPDGLYIEYTMQGGGLGMSKVKFTRLSPELQKQFGYDADKARDHEAKVAKANEDFRQESIRSAQIESAARQVRERENEQVAEARRTTQLNAARAIAMSRGGYSYSWSSQTASCYGGVVANPKTGAAPPARIDYAPIVRPIPFPQVNTPRNNR